MSAGFGVAHHEIDTDPLTPEQVAEKIIQPFGK